MNLFPRLAERSALVKLLVHRRIVIILTMTPTPPAGSECHGRQFTDKKTEVEVASRLFPVSAALNLAVSSAWTPPFQALLQLEASYPLVSLVLHPSWLSSKVASSRKLPRTTRASSSPHHSWFFSSTLLHSLLKTQPDLYRRSFICLERVLLHQESRSWRVEGSSVFSTPARQERDEGSVNAALD